MAEHTVPKGLIKRKSLSFEDWISLHERVSRSHDEIYAIQQRIELVHAFADYEADKTLNDPPIQIHALAKVLGDIEKLIQLEVSNLWDISMAIFPYDATGSGKVFDTQGENHG